MKQLTPQKVAQYQRDGYAVFTEVFDGETVSAVKKRMGEIVDDLDMDVWAKKIPVFSTENSNKQ